MAARPWSLPLGVAFLLSACTTWKVDHRRASSQKAHERGPVALLVGKRCTDASCRCRVHGDDAEDPPPLAGKKRVEIRMSAMGGKVTLDSPSAGHFEQSGPQDACFYVDLEVGLLHDFHLDSQEDRKGGGVVPHVRVAEYGPKGPYWYDILDIACGLGARGCDLDSAREWGNSWLARRKRGRLDACGSIVVSGLRWTTSGGEAADKGGLLRDFEVQFALDVKTFATEFPPGATECSIGH
ncbi:MAG: hypothetical protein JXP73_21035 [Deltaproteobacteria bacterium]|nr:hypothetical protein [Deltaproteobacteria bacterium]